MIYQTQVTVKLNNGGNIQNYVTGFNLNETITVADFKQEIKNTIKFLDQYTVEKETVFLRNTELNNTDNVPMGQSGLQYILEINKK